MKTNPIKQGALTENSTGIGSMTRKMVRIRAVELAIINGRSAQEVSKSDWEQAKRELTGELEMDPKEAVLESAPESDRWNPVTGSGGRKVRVASSADKDDEGRSDNEKTGLHHRAKCNGFAVQGKYSEQMERANPII